jgi:hypothetical protein
MQETSTASPSLRDAARTETLRERGSQKSKVKSQKAYRADFLAVWNGCAIYAPVVLAIATSLHQNS